MIRRERAGCEGFVGLRDFLVRVPAEVRNSVERDFYSTGGGLGLRMKEMRGGVRSYVRFKG
jgi:hypothetical protein